MAKLISNKLRGIILVIAILAIFITPITGATNNWNMFQENVEHNGFMQEGGDFVTNLWTHNIGNPIKSSPAIQNKIMYLVSEKGLLESIDMEKGDTLWKCQLNGNVIGSPVIKGNNLFIGTNNGTNSEYMNSYNIDNEKLSWKFKVSKPIESTAVVSDNTLYFGADNGKIYALDTSDGSKIWEKKLEEK